MAMGSQGRGGLLSEINVTPMVDVMLVLLIIFMITSSAETVERKKEEEKKEDIFQKVPINLPKVASEKVNREEAQKLLLSINKDLAFYIGDGLILDCGAEVPALKKMAASGELFKVCDEADPSFQVCINKLGKILLENEKLKEEGELYLRADKAIPYGCVLLSMAKIREAGVTKFGLIAESPPEK